MNFLRHLTADRARELLNYAPETGAFTWRVARPNGAKPSQPAGSRRHDYMILRLDGALKHIGAFSTQEAAHRAYVERKRQVHAACTI